MNTLLELYEKLYFHEIESREQLNSRLQMPLTLIIALAGVLAYLFQGFDRVLTGIASYGFSILLTFAVLALLLGCYHFVRAAWGQTYLFLPYARATEDYSAELKSKYTEYDAKYGTKTAQLFFDEYLQRYFIDAATANAQINDVRSIHLHKTSRALIVTAVLAVLSFASFVLGDLGGEQAAVQVLLTRPVEVRGISIPERFFVVPDQTSHSAARDAVRDASQSAGGTDDKPRAPPATSAAPPPPDASDQRGRASDRATSTMRVPSK
jgi:hypothetical protein